MLAEARYSISCLSGSAHHMGPLSDFLGSFLRPLLLAAGRRTDSGRGAGRGRGETGPALTGRAGSASGRPDPRGPELAAGRRAGRGRAQR